MPPQETLYVPDKTVASDAGRNVSHKKQTIMATRDLKEFNEWFSRMYERLKEKVSIHGRLDEDRFHDAYLAVRKQVMSSKDGIMDLESYFIGCYQCMAQVTEREDARTTCPLCGIFSRKPATSCTECRMVAQ